jgi:hypothetical protein
VVATEHGFVVVGVVDGQRDPQLDEVLDGRSADWTSSDGRSWQAAEIQPAADADRLTFTGAYAAAEGLLAIATDTTAWPGYRSGWTSLDGRPWTPVTFSGQLMDQQSFDGWWLTGQGLVFSGTHQVWLAAAS